MKNWSVSWFFFKKVFQKAVKKWRDKLLRSGGKSFWKVKKSSFETLVNKISQTFGPQIITVPSKLRSRREKLGC